MRGLTEFARQRQRQSFAAAYRYRRPMGAVAPAPTARATEKQHSHAKKFLRRHRWSKWTRKIRSPTKNSTSLIDDDDEADPGATTGFKPPEILDSTTSRKVHGQRRMNHPLVPWWSDHRP